MTKPSKKSWIAIILILGALWLASAIFANIASLVSVQPENLGTGNVAVIPIKGVITADTVSDFTGSTGASATKIVDRIEKASDNDKIKAIILEINSPGGSAVASEEIAKAVERTNKTTVAWIREVGASGAYWVASASDHIIASEVSVTGSIGVISSYLEVAQLLEDYNVTYRRLVAGEYKDMGSPLKELEEDEEAILQAKLDKVHQYFIQEVALNRNMTEQQVAEFANGLTYLGREAKEIGLIDELGGEKEAIAYVENIHNITAETVTYSSRKPFLDLFSGVTASHGRAMGIGLGEELKSSDESLYIRT